LELWETYDPAFGLLGENQQAGGKETGERSPVER
jgi:hypothetical protein